MNSIDKALLAAAVLAAALPAAASRAPNPSDEIPATNTSDELPPDGRAGGRYGVNASADASATRNPNANTNAELDAILDQDANRKDAANARADRPPKHKRSFWDRLLGRNKRLGADRNAADTRTGDFKP